MGSDINKDDTRTPNQIAYDAIVDQVRVTGEQVRQIAEVVQSVIEHTKNGQSQQVHVIHENKGMGAWGAAAVTACFFTGIMLIALLVWLVPIVHDHDAYIHRHSDQISKLQEQRK